MTISDEDILRRNAILTQLPGREFRAVASRLRLLDTAIGQRIYTPHRPITTVQFPLTAVFALVGMDDHQALVEVATVGREGVLGLPIYLGASASAQAVTCQVAGHTAGLPADDFRAAVGTSTVLRAALDQFTHATLIQMAQNVVCHRSHDSDARAARWLLTIQDRTGHETIPLTQQTLAQMLGLHRLTVSETFHRLDTAGLIHHRRGAVTITDRDGLHAISCPCYDIVAAEFHRSTHPHTADPPANRSRTFNSVAENYPGPCDSSPT